MAERVNYLGVSMEAKTVEVLVRLDAEQRVPTSGLWLYAIIRAVRCQQMYLATDDVYGVIWSSLAIQKLGGEPYLHATYQETMLSALESAQITIPARPDPPYSSRIALVDVASFDPFLGRTEGHSILYDNALLITPAMNPIETLALPPHATSVVIGGVWRLVAWKSVDYVATDREKLLTILLAAMQPKTVVLGMNVVFDGKMKPTKSKISFSGTGGQIGEGDVLICHPDDLNHYSPLPGAVALVLGDVTDPVQAFTCALPVGDEVLTVVIK